MPDDQAYTIFAQSIDRTGYARGSLAPRERLSGSGLGTVFGRTADFKRLEDEPVTERRLVAGIRLWW